MVAPAMAQTKTSKRKSPTRRTSVLTKVADAAKLAKLIETLDAAGWNLTKAGDALGMTPQAVSAALKRLDRRTYDKAISDGRIAGGRPTKSDV